MKRYRIRAFGGFRAETGPWTPSCLYLITVSHAIYFRSEIDNLLLIIDSLHVVVIVETVSLSRSEVALLGGRNGWSLLIVWRRAAVGVLLVSQGPRLSNRVRVPKRHAWSHEQSVPRHIRKNWPADSRLAGTSVAIVVSVGCCMFSRGGWRMHCRYGSSGWGVYKFAASPWGKRLPASGLLDLKGAWRNHLQMVLLSFFFLTGCSKDSARASEAVSAVSSGNLAAHDLDSLKTPWSERSWLVSGESEIAQPASEAGASLV